MPLTFDERGLLPPGVHDATLAEVEAAFARFQRSDRRVTLFEKLKAYLAELGRTGWQCEVILDGSFVMPPVDEPNDIDLILVLPSDWDVSRPLKPFEYNWSTRHSPRGNTGSKSLSYSRVPNRKHAPDSCSSACDRNGASCSGGHLIP